MYLFVNFFLIFQQDVSYIAVPNAATTPTNSESDCSGGTLISQSLSHANRVSPATVSSNQYVNILGNKIYCSMTGNFKMFKFSKSLKPPNIFFFRNISL